MRYAINRKTFLELNLEGIETYCSSHGGFTIFDKNYNINEIKRLIKEKIKSKELSDKIISLIVEYDQEEDIKLETQFLKDLEDKDEKQKKDYEETKAKFFVDNSQELALLDNMQLEIKYYEINTYINYKEKNSLGFNSSVK